QPVHLLAASAARIVTPPRTETERLVVQAWTQVLGNPDISIDDDFFLDLGGHSLVAAQAVSAMRAGLGTAQISVRDLYAHRTVEKLAAQIEHNRSKQTAPMAAAPAISPSQAAFESVPVW